MKKTITRVMIALSAMMTLTVGFAASPVSAHTPEVTADCVGVSISLTSYQGPSYGNSTNNYVEIELDGAPAGVAPFATEYVRFIEWPTEAATHSYKVIVDANTTRGDETRYDRTLEGSVTDCPVSPPTTEPEPEPEPPTTEPPLPPVTTPEPDPTTPPTSTPPGTEPDPSTKTPETSDDGCTGICGPATVDEPEVLECTPDGRYRPDLGRCEYPGAPYCPNEGDYPQAYELDAPCGPVDPCTDAGTTLWRLQPCEVPTLEGDTPTDSAPVVTSTGVGDLPATGSPAVRVIAFTALVVLLIGILALGSSFIGYTDDEDEA